MYTPIALKEKTTGYIPVKARMTEDEIRTADILDLPGLGEMKGTTGAMVEDVLDPYEVAKTIQEEIAKSGASLTLTYLRQKEITSEELRPGIEQGFKELVFGKEPLKPIEQRIAEAEITLQREGLPFIGKQKWAEGREAFFAPIGVGATIVLDFTGLGGGKTAVIKILTKMDDVAKVGKIMKDINVAKDLIDIYAPLIAKAKKEAEVAKYINKIEEMQKTTKVSVPMGKVAKGIKEVKPEVSIRALKTPDAIITQEAKQLMEIESGLKGGFKFGAEGMKVRGTEHSMPYREFYREHGYGPKSLAHWKEIAERELGAGRSAIGQAEAFRAIKQAKKAVLEKEINIEDLFKETEAKTLTNLEKEKLERMGRGSIVSKNEKARFLKSLTEDILTKIKRSRELTPVEANKVGKMYADFIKTSGMRDRLITVPESVLLKTKMRTAERAAAKGFKAGEKMGRQEMKQQLLKTIAGRETKRVVKAETEKELQTIADDIKNRITRILSVQRGKLRSRIAYRKMIGEFNQTVINEIKQELGIEKPLRKMSQDELKQVLESVQDRLTFKMKRGFKPDIKFRNVEKPAFTREFYQTNQKFQKVKKPIIAQVKETLKHPGEFIENIGGVISTRLENIHPSLKRAIRKLEWNITTSINRDQKVVRDFLQELKPRKGIFGKRGINEIEYAELDLAFKNGDEIKINELVEKYGAKKEYLQVRKTLDDIWQRAKEVGYDIGYQKGYWPRVIEDSEGFLEHFIGRDDWSRFDAAIKEKEMYLGRALKVDEKAHLINTGIRGYGRGQISLSKTAAMKERVLDFVDAELNQFYLPSDQAIFGYIDNVNDVIESRRFFGKYVKVDPSTLDKAMNVEESIGNYVVDLMVNNKITVKQEKELTSILRARFNPGKMNRFIGTFRNIGYMTVMGSPYNAITQIGDLGFPIYSGGIKETLKALPGAIMGKAKITRADVGMERIAMEFSDVKTAGKALDNIFTIIGLKKIDSIGKETLMSATIGRLQNEAKRPILSKQFMKEITDVFGDQTDEVIKALKNDEITDDVKYLAFNKLLDFQPVALSEMPEAYLRAGNGKVFYMLKTWSIKMIDVYRREAIQKMTKKETFAEGFKNLLYLTGALTLTNATADQLKNIITGQDIDLDDQVIESMAKLFFASRWEREIMAKEGIGTKIVEEIVPPTNVIDDLWKDIMKWSDAPASFEVNDIRSLKNIPVGGKLYYWWFGKAAQQKKTSGELDLDLDLDLNLETDLDLGIDLGI